MSVWLYMTILAPKPVGRRARKPGIDRKPRQAYSAKQLDRLESEFKVCTGWPRPFFGERNGYNSETVHFWPHVGKAKMRLTTTQFFNVFVNKQTAENLHRF